MKKRYGRWTVIREVKPVGNHRRHECICSCFAKTVKVVLRNNLIRGLTKSCGCLQSEIRNQQRYDMIGKTSGRLMIIDFSHTCPRSNCSVLVYVCICGSIGLIRRSSIVNGTSKSCGCFQKQQASSAAKLRRKILPLGDYGTYRVIGTASSGRQGRSRSKCECTLCRKEFVADDANLKNGNTKSCGCLVRILAYERSTDIEERTYITACAREAFCGRSNAERRKH